MSETVTVTQGSAGDEPMRGPDMIVDAIREALPSIRNELRADTFTGGLVASLTIVPKIVPDEGEVHDAPFVAQIVIGVKLVAVTPEELKDIKASIQAGANSRITAELDAKATAPTSNARN